MRSSNTGSYGMSLSQRPSVATGGLSLLPQVRDQLVRLFGRHVHDVYVVQQTRRGPLARADALGELQRDLPIRRRLAALDTEVPPAVVEQFVRPPQKAG